MVTRTRTKRIKDNRPTANPDDLHHWIQRNDIALYASRKKIKDAREQCSNELNAKVTTKAFRSMIGHTCKWFTMKKRRAKAKRSDLTGKQWDKIKKAVGSMLVELHEQPIHVAAELVRSRVSVNETILRGLPERLQVWSKEK